MTKFNVYANDCEFGMIEAATQQEARDAAAQMAGYESEADMVERLGQPSEIVAEEAPTRLIGRETAIDDREAVAVVREGDQTIGVWSIETAPTPFLKELVEQAVENGEATAQDSEGCTVTAVLVGQ